MTDKPFLTDIAELRRRARQHIEEGAVTEAYRGNRLSVDLVDAAASGNTEAIETRTIEDKGRAYHSSYFEMLGEQGWPGLALWLLLHLLGVWQMEKVYRRYRRNREDDDAWIAPLASALQQAQIVYLVGSGFVGIAFQPFCYMIVALQCGLWSWVKRRERRSHGKPAATSGPSLAAGVA